MEVLHRFRTAIGGFNRRDVLKYIEASDAAHRSEKARLEECLRQAEQVRDELERTLEGVQDEKGTVAAEEARVRASLEASSQALARVRGELEQTEEELTREREELARLRGQVAQLAPMAQNYEELKDRVATVELDAHRKAQATLNDAQAQARALKDDTAAWVSGVMDAYGELRAQVDGLSGMLQEALRLVDGVRACTQAAEQLRERGTLT